MRTLLALCSILFVTSGAMAAELPEWQTENGCVALAGGAENKDQLVFEACMTEEKRSKDILRGKYGELSDEITSHCERRSSIASPSYSTLRACIEAKIERN